MKGKVNLEDLPFQISTLPDAELWQKVLNSINSKEMPPEDKKQPENEEKADFLDALANTMVLARKSLSDSGGKITMRRLNRREYQNTIKHLTGITVDVSSLPADGGGGTFDTEGASQFISSDQFEQYLKLGRSAVDEMFARRVSQQQPSRKFRVEPEETVNVKNLETIKQLQEKYQLLKPWMDAVDKATKAPENEAIMAQLRKEHSKIDSHPYLIYRKSNRLKGVPELKHFGGDPDSAMNFYQLSYQKSYESLKYYAELPHNDRGMYLRQAAGVVRLDVGPPKGERDLPPGKYRLRFRAGIVEGSPTERHFIEVGHPQRINQVPAGFANPPLSSHQVTGTITNPQVIETIVEISIDSPKEFGIQERMPKDYGARIKKHYRDRNQNGHGTPPALWVDWIELEGPISDTSLTASKTYRVEPEETINPANEKDIKSIIDAQARYTKWKAEVDKIKDTPENLAIIAEIAKTQEKLVKHPTHFYRFADKLKGAPDAKDFGFIDSAKAFSNGPAQDRAKLAYHKHYASLPGRDRGTWLKLAHGVGRVVVAVEDLAPGNYTLRVSAGVADDAPATRRFIDIGYPQRQVPRERGLVGQPLASRQVSGSIDKPEIIEIPIEIGIDTPREFTVQEKQPNNGNLKALWKTFDAQRKENGYGIPPAIWIDWVELKGPINAKPDGSSPPKMDWWVGEGAGLDEATRAREILKQFAHEAFRDLPAGDDYLERLVALFQTRRAKGDSFDIAIRTPLSVILASPGFLYLNEPSNEENRRELNDRELAVRLAYFLWSSPPDDQLLALARENQLHKPEVLRQQVDRLLADSRSDEFVSGFVHQWLDMERLDFFQFDTTLHREFDESTRAASRREVYESFAYLLRNPSDGQLGKLLKSDYVFINGLLGSYYGIEGVTGDKFRRVDLPADSPRGGLLGMAAIHAMGSDGIESSPVERGAWVLRHLLHDPPPPAPPNVPQLSRLADKPLTTREKLAAHMEEAQCASCHRKIDPIGFGLENFNAAGKWREKEGKGKRAHKIDPSGVFHNGPAFDDYYEMRDLIAGREDDFARGFVEHLIGYGLGRPFGFTDEDLAEEIVAGAKSKQFAVSEFVHALVQSEAFKRK